MSGTKFIVFDFCFKKFQDLLRAWGGGGVVMTSHVGLNFGKVTFGIILHFGFKTD